jgi:hypothetical protein
MAIVYRHIRKDKNEPFYIGIGVSEKRAFDKIKRSDFWKKVAEKGYEVEILFNDLTWEMACEKEIEFIKLYGRKDGGGILANLTDGGDGTLGLIVSEKTRKENSERHSGKNNPMYGKSHPKELIEQIRLKNIGRVSWNKGKKGVYTDSQLKKMSEIKKGKTPWNKGVSHSEETKKKMSEARKKFVFTPEICKKISISKIGVKRGPYKKTIEQRIR